MHNVERFDSALGIILGAAVGDALGAPLEFLPPRDPQNFVREMTGGGVLKWQPGQITDDTIMSICIQEMYMEKKMYDQETIIQKWIAWKDTKPKDIGNWTYKALNSWNGYDFSENNEAHPPHDLWNKTGQKSAGNGAVMRCMPTAVIRWNNPGCLVAESVHLAEDTHPDPRCLLSCVVVNQLLAMGIQGKKKKEAFNTVLLEFNQLQGGFTLGFLRDAEDFPEEEWNNNGYTLDTVRCAVAAWLQNDDFEEALVKIVNRGNDADTVGAVTGALMGAYHGFSKIPTRWLQALERNHELVRNAQKLLELSDVEETKL